MGNWLSSIVDSVLDYLDDLSDKRSWLKWRSESKKQLFQEKLQPQVAAAVRHKSVARVTNVEVPGPNDIPHIFTTTRPLNVEWNLCDKADPARRVDVVHCDTRTLAQNELEIMCYISNFCETYKQPIHRNTVHLLGYYSICSGLQFLHEHGVAHGNLGLENIFVTSDNILKIGDFEHAVFVGSDNQLQPLSKLPPPPLKTYIAPEIEAFKPGERLDLQKADVWSVGIIFILLLTKKPLFDAARLDDNGFQMFSRVGLRSYLKVMYLEQSAICKLSDELLEFAEGLLNLNSSLRFTMRRLWTPSG
ncbi:Protein kinase-like domain [Phytophthora cactorum]|nr:Protein kinase-like domain [Phytophthora cactorum]